MLTETKKAPTLEDICTILGDGELKDELRKYPEISEMDDLGLKFLLYKLINVAEYTLRNKVTDVQVIHRTAGFLRDASDYIKNPKLKQEILENISCLESGLQKKVDNVGEYVESGSNLEGMSLFYKMLSKGKSSIQKDKNAALKKAAWGENDDSDTLVGTKSELFSLALGYLGAGLFNFASGEKEKAQENISMANEELSELSELLESRSDMSALVSQYYDFHKEISALGFNVKNYLPKISKKAESMPYGSSSDSDFNNGSDVKFVFAEFYGTPGIPLQFNHIDVSEEGESELAGRMLGTYLDSLSALADHIKSADKPAEPEADQSALDTMAVISKDSAPLYHFKERATRFLSECDNLPVLKYFTSGVKKNYDVNLAWDVLKGAVPAFADAESAGLTDICRNLDRADPQMISRAMNFGGFGIDNSTPFAEKLKKSFSYINNRLK